MVSNKGKPPDRSGSQRGSHMLVLREYAELGIVRDRLHKAVADGTLTEQLLHDAVDTIDHAGYETIPESIGMGWILNHTTDNERRTCCDFNFGVWIEENGINLADFFRQHMNNHHIEWITRSHSIMQLIPTDERLAFVRDMLMHFNHETGERWIRCCLEVGISREDLAQLVLDRLHAGDYAENFLVYGSGERCAITSSLSDGVATQWGLPANNTCWSLLSDDQLVKTLMLCAEQAPKQFYTGFRVNSSYTAAEKMLLRLPYDLAKEVMLHAATCLPDLKGASTRALSLLQPEDRDIVLYIHNGGENPFLLTWVAAQLDYDAGMAILDEYGHTFNEGDPVSLYRHLWMEWKPAERPLVVNHALNRALVAAKAKGYRIGTVQTGKHRGQSEYFVLIDGTKYVNPRYHSPFVQPDEWVFVRLGAGSPLGGQNTILLQNLTPARRNDR